MRGPNLGAFRVKTRRLHDAIRNNADDLLALVAMALLAAGGVYARLYQLQFRDEAQAKREEILT